jgi:hypothetical protein
VEVDERRKVLLSDFAAVAIRLSRFLSVAFLLFGSVSFALAMRSFPSFSPPKGARGRKRFDAARLSLIFLLANTF